MLTAVCLLKSGRRRSFTPTSGLIGLRPAAGRLRRVERGAATTIISPLLKPTSCFFAIVGLINLRGARLRLCITDHLLTGCRARRRRVHPRLSRRCTHQSQSVARRHDGSLLRPRQLIINEGRGEGRAAG